VTAKPRPKTEFPSPDVSANPPTHERNVSDNRYTRFPAGLGLRKLLTTEKTELPIVADSEGEEAVHTTFSIPLKVNPPDATPKRLSPERKSISPTSRPQTKNPWDVYTALRPLQRGGEVTAASTQTAPIKMVAIKKLSSSNFKEFRSCQHKNLLSIIEIYQFKGQFFVVTDYTATTLRHIIAIPLPLEEPHVSATCRQESSLPRSSIHLTNVRQVFEGMQYLSRFGIAHKKLDGSKVLFSADGCVKIGTINMFIIENH
jgi:hypothetical protein